MPFTGANVGSSTGTWDINSLLAARNTSEKPFGTEDIINILQQDLLFHNQNVADAVSLLVRMTKEVQALSGASHNVVGQRADEYGRPPAEEDVENGDVAFPLHRNVYSTGWTQRWLERATPADMAERQIAIRIAHLFDIVKNIRDAIHKPTNRTIRDTLVDNVSITVRALVNADSEPIPNNPQSGAAFDPAAHTHYTATATLTVAGVNALIANVKEHSVNALPIIAINDTDVAGWTALTGFLAAQDPGIGVFRNTALVDVPAQRLDIGATNNYFLGLFNTARVWVKPWTVANYAICFDANGPKALAMREDDVPGTQGLRMSEPTTANPLRVEWMEAMFGVGASTRYAAAVYQFDNSSYVDPTTP